jgi:hypothetical protein
MKVLDYRRVLGLSVNDTEKADRFYAQMHNYFIAAGAVEFDSTVELAFCNKIGVPMEKPNPLVMDLWTEPKGIERAWIYLKKYESNLRELLFGCVELINSYPNSKKQKITKPALTDVLLNALDDCQIAYEVMHDEDGIFVFPKGAKELDDVLVSEPLLWLSDYPKARNAFIKALKEYSEVTADNASDVADKFRKALETFFQEFFGGGRSLEKYMSDHTYERYLDKCGVPPDIRDEFKNTVNSYAKFINNNAKHHDGTELNVLEYLMYQTGNIIRLLITLKREEPDHAD